MCMFSAPDIPPAPVPAQRQQIRTPAEGATGYNRADDIVRRRQAMNAAIFTGAAALGAPTTTPTILGG